LEVDAVGLKAAVAADLGLEAAAAVGFAAAAVDLEAAVAVGLEAPVAVGLESADAVGLEAAVAVGLDAAVAAGLSGAGLEGLLIWVSWVLALVINVNRLNGAAFHVGSGFHPRPNKHIKILNLLTVAWKLQKPIFLGFSKLQAPGSRL